MTLNLHYASAFCFLLEVDEMGHRVHLEVDLEMEEEARLESEAQMSAHKPEIDPMKQLETNIDNLSGE